MLDGRTLLTAAIILYICALLWGRYEQYCLWTVLFVVFISFIAFHAEPIYDLNNYYAGQGYKASLSFLAFFDEFKGADEIGAQLWMWIWSKFRYLGMLPAMTVFTFYSMMLATLFAVWKLTAARKEYFILAVIFLLCTTKYYSVVGGVRNHMGFLIFAVSLISELLLKKDWRLCFVGYLVALSFHTSVFAFIIIRVFLAIYRRWPSQFLMALLLAAAAFGYPIIEFISDVTGNEYLAGIAETTEAYYGTEGAPDDLSLGNLSTACVKIVCIILLLLYAYTLYRKEKLHPKYRGYLDYFTAAIVLTIGASTSQHTLVRFPELLGMLAAPLLMLVLTAGEKVWEDRAPSRIRARSPQYPTAFFWLFLLDSGMFAAFQFMGTWTLIGWQTPALTV